MAEDVRGAMGQRPDLIVEVVQDAAPEMWDLVRAALLPLRRPDCVAVYFEAIDLPHAIGHLADALLATGNDEATRTATLERWRVALKARDSAIDEIAQELTACRPRGPRDPRDRIGEPRRGARLHREQQGSLAIREAPATPPHHREWHDRECCEDRDQSARQGRRTAVDGTRPARSPHHSLRGAEQPIASLLGPLLTPLRGKCGLRAIRRRTCATSRVIRAWSTPSSPVSRPALS